MHEAAQHPRPRQPFKVRARLASPLAEALYLPYPEAPSDEIVQSNAPYDEVTPCLDRCQLYALAGNSSSASASTRVRS